MDTAVHEIADGRLPVLDVGGECRPRGLSFNQFLMRRTSSCCFTPGLDRRMFVQQHAPPTHHRSRNGSP